MKLTTLIAVLVFVVAAGHSEARVQRPGLTASTFDARPVADASSREGSVADPPTGAVQTDIRTGYRLSSSASEPRGHGRVSSEYIADSLIGGLATWYCGHGSSCTKGYGPSDMVAAIDPSLGIRRGTLVTVRHGGKAVLVRIVDVCGCRGRRVIDLTSGAFARLASLDSGVIAVELEVATLPQTDTEEGT